MPKLAKAEGQLVVKEKDGVSIEYYSHDFVLDDAVKTKEQARSMLQAGLLTEALKKEVPNFKRWRTCDVVEFTETTRKAEHSDLDKALLEATELGCVPEGIENYKRPDYKLKALQTAIEKFKARAAKKVKDNVQDLGYVD